MMDYADSDLYWSDRKEWRLRTFNGSTYILWRGSEPRFRPDPFGSLLYVTTTEDGWDVLTKRKEWASDRVVRRYWRWADSQEEEP